MFHGTFLTLHFLFIHLIRNKTPKVLRIATVSMIKPLIYLHKPSLLPFSWLLQMLCRCSMNSHFSDTLSIKPKFHTFLIFHHVYISLLSHHPHFPSWAFLMFWKALRKKCIRNMVKEEWWYGSTPSGVPHDINVPLDS